MLLMYNKHLWLCHFLKLIKININLYLLIYPIVLFVKKDFIKIFFYKNKYKFIYINLVNDLISYKKWY